jgi:hypothetical protein
MKRLLCALLALAVLSPAPGGAFGPQTQFRLAVLAVEPGMTERVTGLERLAYEVRKRTSIEAANDVAQVALEGEALFAAPFTVIPVCRELRPLTGADAALLRRYLDLGGFLLIDNCQGRRGGAAERWARAAVAQIYPDRALRPLPADHSLTRSFYLIDRAFGRTSDAPDLEGVDEGDRTVIVYHPGDLLGALMRDPFGNPVFEVPERQREMAQRQGINLVMYALTLNYKKDQIHIPFILKRRRQ